MTRLLDRAIAATPNNGCYGELRRGLRIRYRE